VADPRAFISFDFDNNETERVLFVGQAKNSRTPFNIQDWSSKQQLPQGQWEILLKDKINQCHMLIVLVGRYMATATGCAKEIEMASRQNVPIFGVYVGGADANSTLPAGLARNRVIAWDWDKIASAVAQMMREGKNVQG
jgi:hypothetical protein